MVKVCIGPFKSEQLHFTEVDEQDLHLLKEFNWYLDRGYVKTRRQINRDKHGNRTYEVFYLHRLIMNTPDNMHTDHIDNDRTNNSRSNLRICIQADNNKNVSGVCVYLEDPERRPNGKREKPWTAKITHNYERIHIGRYATEDEALEAVRLKKIELRGEYANLS